MVFKFFTTIILTGFLLNANAAKDVQKEDKAGILSIYKIYFEALKTGNIYNLKQSSTPRFIKELGGIKEVEKNFKILKKSYHKSKIHSYEIVSHKKSDSLFYGQINYKDDHGHIEMAGTTWFYIVKKKGKFYFDTILSDFDPSHEDPPIGKKNK